MTTNSPSFYPVRIVADSTNSDGWIAKLISSPKPELAGKIAFIANLSSVIQELVPGQLWEALPISQTDKYWIVQLTARIS